MELLFGLFDLQRWKNDLEVEKYTYSFFVFFSINNTMESMEIIQEIPPLILKNLGDRSYEKRKAAAFEIESIIHQINVDDTTESSKN